MQYMPCAKGDLVQRIPFQNQEWSPGKKFPNAAIMARRLFFVGNPKGGGGYTIFSPGARFFSTPPLTSQPSGWTASLVASGLPDWGALLQFRVSIWNFT